MKRINSWLNEGFVFTWAFSILSVSLYVWRAPLHVLSNCHEIWNYHTWYKGRATYMSGYFISLLFKYGGCFVDLLRSYRQNALTNSQEIWILKIFLLTEHLVLTWVFSILTVRPKITATPLYRLSWNLEPL